MNYREYLDLCSVDPNLELVRAEDERAYMPGNRHSFMKAKMSGGGGGGNFGGDEFGNQPESGGSNNGNKGRFGSATSQKHSARKKSQWQSSGKRSMNQGAFKEASIRGNDGFNFGKARSARQQQPKMQGFFRQEDVDAMSRRWNHGASSGGRVARLKSGLKKGASIAGRGVKSGAGWAFRNNLKASGAAYLAHNLRGDNPEEASWVDMNAMVRQNQREYEKRKSRTPEQTRRLQERNAWFDSNVRSPMSKFIDKITGGKALQIQTPWTTKGYNVDYIKNRYGEPPLKPNQMWNDENSEHYHISSGLG